MGGLQIEGMLCTCRRIGNVTNITFPAQVVKVQTLADGGLRVTFDLPETAILAAAHLMECKRVGVAGEVTFKAIVSQGREGDDGDGFSFAL